MATLLERGEERIIGVARYARVAGDDRPADVAFAVADEHQGRGIGTVLLDHLLRVARRQGVTEFQADVLGENNRMLEVFSSSGLVVTRSLADGIVHLSFPVEETERSRELALARGMRAAAESVRTILNPRSVAVIGASREPDTIGAALVQNLQRAGFTGPVFAVNPKGGDVFGLPAHPHIGAIGQAVDLAIVAVPATAVEGVVRECAAAGVRGVVVISAGFAEVSDAGREVQRRIVQVVRGSGMRMVGPNCMGLLNTDPAVSLNGSFAPLWPPAGNVAMLTQSGALGLAILDYARQLHIGLSTFVSVGNKADVSGNDLLSYWADDPRTRVVVRITPAWSMSASTATSRLASAAEWREGARVPDAERPDLTATMGLRRATSGAIRANFRGLPKLSR